MKIEVSGNELHILAEAFASEVHAAVVQMHLRRSWGIWEDGAGECPYQREPAPIQRIRDALRSIRNPYARASFVRSIRYLYHELRKEKGTTVKWQDYVASVRRAYAENQRNKLEVA